MTSNDEDVILEDGYPAMMAHIWALEKHERLRKYIDISKGVRKKFIRGSGGATYIDLFSGPGKSYVKETGQIIDGSPLVACECAESSGSQFQEVHLADTNAAYLEAVKTRLSKFSVEVKTYHGEAANQIDAVLNSLNPYGLHFAFLDPFALSPLSFAIIKKLCALKHIDLLIHVSLYDMQVNYHNLLREDNPILDRFAPGWRDKVNITGNQKATRIAIVSHWTDLMKLSGVESATGAELVTGEQGQNLYWLVFAARNELARKFWDSVRNINKQHTML